MPLKLNRMNFPKYMSSNHVHQKLADPLEVELVHLVVEVQSEKSANEGERQDMLNPLHFLESY